MHLTVLVPTANRPSFLPSTLKSIANQTAKRHIKRVIVSENGGYHGSKEIAYSFKNELPIEWIYQQESLTPQQHGIWLANQVATPFVAQIADDDMWDKYHLEESLLQLSHNQDSIAYFGQTVLVTDDSCWPRGVFTPPFGSVAAQNQNCPQTHLNNVEVWKPRDTALNSLSSTPLNIWSVVAKTPAHCKAIAESAGHPTLGKCPSNDSLYIWRLSVQGDILIGRHVSLFYRTHPESDIQSCMRERPSQTNEEDLMIRKEIYYQALSLGIDALDDWRMAYKKLPGVIRQQIPTFSRLNLDWLIDSKSSHWYAQKIYKHLKLATKLILPPFILIGLLKCIKLFSMLKYNMFPA
jgi:glycosyltransferase involved in cell wall biosynthesis